MSLSPRNLFLVLGLAFALIVIGFRVQLLWLERDHLLEQRHAYRCDQAHGAIDSTETARAVGSGP